MGVIVLTGFLPVGSIHRLLKPIKGLMGGVK